MVAQGRQGLRVKALACAAFAWTCIGGSGSLAGFLAPTGSGPLPPAPRPAYRRQLATGRDGREPAVAMRANSAEPSAPTSNPKVRRMQFGKFYSPQGRQVRVRVNRHTNKPILYRMHVQEGDFVQVQKGKDAGKVTQVIRVYRKWNKVLCLGVNFVIKHVRPQREDEVGSRVQVEHPLHASNLLQYDKEEGVAGYLGIRWVPQKVSEGGDMIYYPERYNKATGNAIPNRVPPKWTPVLERGEEEDDE